MAHKTKATRYGGPSTQATRYPQRMSIANNATFAAGGQCDQCAGLLVGYSCSLALRRWRRLISPLTAVTINCALLSPSSKFFLSLQQHHAGIWHLTVATYYLLNLLPLLNPL